MNESIKSERLGVKGVDMLLLLLWGECPDTTLVLLDIKFWVFRSGVPRVEGGVGV